MNSSLLTRGILPVTGGELGTIQRDSVSECGKSFEPDYLLG